MRILLAQKFARDPSGGHSGNRLRLAGELERQGVEVDTFFGSDLRNCPPRLRTRLFAWALPGRARRGGYDVVDATAGSSWLLGLRRRPFALVESVYGAEHMYYRRWKAELAKADYRVVVPRFRPWYPWIELPLIARAWRNADHIVCQAEDNREFLVDEGFAPAGKVSVIGSGMGEAFLRTPREKRPVRRILWVASWIVMKGFRYLAEAFELAAREVPGLELTIVGGNPPDDDPLEHFSNEVRERVTNLGKLDRDRMPSVYAEHDAFLFTSLGEGYGNVALEAMASGLPVVSFPVVCARDLIRDGDNGILVPFADGRAAGRALVRLATGPELAAGMGRRARETARGHTVYEDTRALLNLYERLSAERGGRGGEK